MCFDHLPRLFCSTRVAFGSGRISQRGEPTVIQDSPNVMHAFGRHLLGGLQEEVVLEVLAAAKPRPAQPLPEIGSDKPRPADEVVAPQ